MPVEQRGQVIDVELGPTGLYPGRSPKFQRKAAAFMRWHEPDDARVSSPESVRGSGGNSPALRGVCSRQTMPAVTAAFAESGHGILAGHGQTTTISGRPADDTRQHA